MGTTDPTAFDWTTGLLPGLGVIVAGIAAAYAAKSARATELHVEAQTRPLLTKVPREYYTDQEREVILPDGEVTTHAMSGEIPFSVDEAWISLPLRNTGKGEALIQDVWVEVAAVRPHPQLGAGAAASRHVQPGEEVRISVIFGRHRTERERFQEQLVEGAGMIVHVTYSDFAGRQKQDSAFELRRAGNQPWRVTDSWTIKTD